MNLSESKAAEIVKKINADIDQKINIMNEQGIIIASTDPARVNTFHGGARRIVDEGLEELVVHYNGEYEGSLCGTNFPIVVEGKTIGIIGVTGNYDEIVKYALIIKHMTELLLKETYEIEENLLEENIRNRFLNDWILGSMKDINRKFVDRGKLLDIDITLPRRILACSLYSAKEVQDLRTMREVDPAMDFLKKCIRSFGKANLFLECASTLICMIPRRSDEEMAAFAEDIKAHLEEKYPLRLAIGIDSGNHSYQQMHMAYVKANKALQACLRMHKKDIRFYDDINMEIFSDEVTDITKQEYISKIFKGYNHEEIAEAISILETFYDVEGSINAASEKLYIHKNTLQYKLNKIADKTGYNPRSIRHSSLFYIAIYFYRETRDAMLKDE